MLILIQTINFLFEAYMMLLFARIIGSWLPQLNEYRLMQFVSYYTDPYLNFFRSFIPPLGMIDISPIVAFFALSIMQSLIIKLLIGLAV
jgi:YggT family protein